MMNGRALLSASYHGEVRYHSDPGRLHGVKDLLKIQRRMLLPSQHFSIKVDNFHQNAKSSLMLTPPSN